MPGAFPNWFDRWPLWVLAGGILTATAVVAGCWYYLTPKYALVGYQPRQPVAFSHAVHAGQMRVDCRYCHPAAEQTGAATLPPASKCLNCHGQVLKDDPRLAPVREAVATDRPIPWVRVHRLPDFVAFNHAAHVRRGVGCVECHGRVDQMAEVSQAQPLSMAFCLECHRDPVPRLRPLTEVCNLNWQPPPEFAWTQAKKLAAEWQVQPLPYCSTCHR